LMPAAGAKGFQIAIQGHMTGPWDDAGGTIDPDGLNEAACASFHLDGLSSPDNPDGLTALIAEANHGTADSFLYGPSNLCVIDDGTTSHSRIRATREGPADTVTFQHILGVAPAMFHIQVIGDLPTRVYNADTGLLDTDALLGTQTLPMTLKIQIRDDA